MAVSLDSVLTDSSMTRDHPWLKKRVSVKHRRAIAIKIGDWKSCAAFLGVPDVDVDDITDKHRKGRNRRLAMLRLWVEINGNEATYLKLAEALARIERRDLIESLLAMLKADKPIVVREHNIKPLKFDGVVRMTLSSKYCLIMWLIE